MTSCQRSRVSVCVWSCDVFLFPSQENITSEVITNLTPGAQYRVMVYHTNGPLVSPASEPVVIDIGVSRLRSLQTVRERLM